MKKIVYLILAIALLVSCNYSDDSLDIQDDVTCSVGFQLSASSSVKSSSSTMKSEQFATTDVNNAFLKSLTSFKIVNFRSPLVNSSANLVETNSLLFNQIGETGSQEISMENNISSFKMLNVKLGSNTFIGEATQFTPKNDGFYTPSNTDKIYKHFVGITRTLSSGLTSISFAKKFVPQLANWPWASTSTFNLVDPTTDDAVIKNKIIDIAVKDIDKNTMAFNKTIVMEMTPENSIIDIKVRNERKDLYMVIASEIDGVYDNVIINPTAVGTDASDIRFVLNADYVKANSNANVKIYVVEKNSNLNNEFLYKKPFNTDDFTVLNGAAKGQVLFNKTLKGNQHYINKNNESDSSQGTIVLDDDAFTIDTNMLVLFNTEMQSSSLVFGELTW